MCLSSRVSFGFWVWSAQSVTTRPDPLWCLSSLLHSPQMPFEIPLNFLESGKGNSFLLYLVEHPLNLSHIPWVTKALSGFDQIHTRNYREYLSCLSQFMESIHRITIWFPLNLIWVFLDSYLIILYISRDLLDHLLGVHICLATHICAHRNHGLV